MQKTKIASIAMTCLLAAAGLSICQDTQKERAGKLPLDFPIVATAAQEKQFVLAAEKASVDDAFSKGIDKTVFAFYLATMVKPSQAESEVKTISRYNEIVPNSVIIPLDSQQTAKPGDIVLTAWRQGLGMQKGIVVAGGEETEPNVAFFCDSVNSPDDVKPVKCPKGTFNIVKESLQVGSSIAIKQKDEYLLATIVCVSEKKILAVSGGRLLATDKSSCTDIPISPTFKDADSVMVAVDGKFIAGKVKSIAPAVGRVFVAVQVDGKEKVVGAPFGSVIASLP